MRIGDVDKRNVCRYLGFGSDAQPSARLVSLIEKYSEEARKQIRPSYSCVIAEVERVVGRRAYVKGAVMFESEVIARLLDRCSKVALFVVSIGKRLEESTCRLAEDGLVHQACVLDAVGSDAVEQMAEFVQGAVSKVASAGRFVISRRFSPGYCDWDVSQQKTLFRALGIEAAGVRLTEMGLMVPQKSISGIIGIGEPGRRVDRYNPCKFCEKPSCSGRR